MKVSFKTPLRGFFRHLQKEPNIHAEFVFPPTALYETTGTLRNVLVRIAHWHILDLLGVIQKPQAKGDDCDIYGSYNRFLQADKPYFIYVENPTALYHYSIRRRTSKLGKHSIDKSIKDTHLKALVCMSKACKDTFEEVCTKVPTNCIFTQIYPLVPDNPYANEQSIQDKLTTDEPLKLLYIAQGIRFLSKGALEIVDAYKHLQAQGLNLSLTMVTSLNEIDPTLKEQIASVPGLSLCDFTFTFEQLQQLYASHHMLLIPTSDDSSPLTVLEAMKAGLPVITTKLYAIPEMVTDGENGYLTEPAWWYFTPDNKPNPTIWDHEKKTIYAGKKSERITQFLEEKIKLLYEDRALLTQMALNSYHKATTAPFSREYIANQWNELFEQIRNKNN